MEEIADRTIERKTGARGLRAIIEKSMRDLMFTIPSDETIRGCLVTKDVIDGPESRFWTTVKTSRSGQAGRPGHDRRDSVKYMSETIKNMPAIALRGMTVLPP